MMSLKEFMKKVGVTKVKYVQWWIELDLIPGIVKGDSIADTQFPDSARRPYCVGALKPGISADRIRAHIVSACLARQHISKEACFASAGEFDGFISELVRAGLVRKRVEDGITYFDSTTKSETYKGKKLNEIRAFVLEAISACSEGVAKGATAALLEKAAS